VLGAITVATACLLPGSITEGISNLPAGGAGNMVVEHPGGSFAVRLLVADNNSGTIDIKRAGVIRTARMLFRGNVCVPRNLAP
jgi:4-oxalomesaconate tautomerase